VGQINAAVGQMSQGTQQNASSSEELAATAEEMSGQAEQLQAAMGFFRLGSADTGTRRPPSRTAAAPKRRQESLGLQAPAFAAQGPDETSFTRF
jgi:methyl-accepting chemotaxis protein